VYTEVDRPVVLAESNESLVVKVGLCGEPLIEEENRIPLNVAIVLDKSGSMGSHNKIQNARAGAIEIIQRLSSRDVVSVVVYDSVPRVLVPAQQLHNKEKIIALLNDIQAGGNTALYGGVILGADQLNTFYSEDYLNRIILLSDGLANVGPQSKEEIAHLGTMLSKEGISVSTIGVGLDYNEDLMTALADESGGNSYFAQNSDELPTIFAEEIGEAMTLMAQNIKIYLECFDDIRPVSIIGREGQVTGQEMEVRINHLYGKNEKYALFELDIPQNKHGVTQKIARVYVEYVDPYTKEYSSQEKIVSVRFDKRRRKVEKNINKDVVKAITLTRTSELKEVAIKLADEGEYKEAAKVLSKRGVMLEKVAQQCDNDKELLFESEQCTILSKELSKNKGLSRSQRKRVVNDSFTQKMQQGFISRGSQ
jgi:Ca-activated chloride channel family protein